MSPTVAPLSACAELCVHALAYVPFTDPGTSYDPRYLAWARAHGLGGDAMRTDGEIVARAIGPRARALLHHWPALWPDLDALAAARTRALADLTANDVADPALLAAIRAADDPALEVFHATVALELPQWRRVHDDVVRPAMARASVDVASRLATIAEHITTLQRQTIALSWALGPRGRGYATRLVIGAPAPWHDGGPERSIVLALHEHAVRDLAQGDWATVEWSALRRVASWVDAWPELQHAHAAWVARLDLRGLVATLVQRAAIDEVTARALAGADRWATLRAATPP